jgi:Ser/Thr protein kinase RdoA (MazF antagonist)
MRRWFTARRPQEQVEWPSHLAAGLAAYLERNAQRIQSGDRQIIHADLTQDHLLGQVIDGHWQTRAVIDFGDAMFGNLYYELAALHLDLFDCDKRLLKAFLDSYGLEADRDFACRAMTTTLLHQFDVYGHLFTWKPDLKEAASLDVLAEKLWQLDP